MTEKERARKIKKAADYSAKATMDFMTSKEMKEIFANLFTDIYSIAPEDVLENIYDVVGTKKGYVKTSKLICEDESNYQALVNVLEENKPYIMEQFGINLCDFDNK